MGQYDLTSLVWRNASLDINKKRNEKMELISEIRQLSEEIEIIENNYNYIDSGLIYYYTYLIKALEEKFKYLVSKLRSLEVAQ